MKYRAASLLLFAVLVISTIASAQSRYGLSTLTGTVSAFDGTPVRNVRVELRHVLNGHVEAYAYTLPNGTFEMNGVDDGEYLLVAVSGLSQAQERITIEGPSANVVLRIPTADNDAGSTQATVSVAQLKVPDKARNLFRKANEKFNKHDFQEAIRLTDKALEVFPDYAQAMTLRAIFHMDSGKLDEARAMLEKSVQLDSAYGLSYIVLGATYNMMDRFDDALRVLERGLSITPAAWQGYFETAKAMLAKKDYGAALRQLDKAAHFSSENYPPLHLVRAHAYLGLKDYPAAMTELETYLGREPNGADSAAARRTLDQVRAFTANNSAKR